MAGLADAIEEGIRYPGFAFINVQSPCVTYGQEDQQLRVHKQKMQSLKDLGHDTTDRLKAMALAQEYGTSLHTGVFYRNPEPAPTFESAVKDLQQRLLPEVHLRVDVLKMFQAK
jgi:2-oxoglutarate ferredoxin oxidoreductase subunit beta